MRIVSLLIAGLTGLVVLGSSTPVFAWDFTCSPKATKDLTDQTPNVLLMLDRSGSMGFASGVVVNTCRVCESSAGFYYEVPDAGSCPAGDDWTRSASRTRSSGSSGYAHTFNLSTPVATDDMTLEIDITGDFDTPCEWGDVTADGVWVGRIDARNLIDNNSGCEDDTYAPFIFTVPAAVAADGNVEIVIQTSPDNNDCDGDVGPGNCHISSSCDGVDVCSGGSDSNRATITLAHGNTYHGTQTWEDPCGAPDKWEQSLDAIDSLTRQSDGATPAYANFGLGLFYGNTNAPILEPCVSPNNPQIMYELYRRNPSGATPTARAIQRSYQSDCLNPPDRLTRTQSGDVGTDASVSGWDLSFSFSNVPVEDIEVEVRVDGDFGASCEFAAIYVDGQYFGMVGERECRSSTITFTVPQSFTLDGQLDILVDTRGDGEATSSPLRNCSAGADGVDAYCGGANGASVAITHTNNFPRPGATILINDGEPTRETDGGTNKWRAYRDAITQACLHRRVGPLFVVGLGAGTDEDYNNVLAAAGGTGSCVGGADPCDNPNDWEDYMGSSSDGDGDCTGAIQADSRDDLLAALESITSQLACTFNIEFFNSGYTEVPPDPSNAYPYLAVDVYNTYLGATEAICHAEHPDTSSAGAVCIADPSHVDCNCDDPMMGEGWEFTNDSRSFIQFSDYYCNNVRSYLYTQGSTQLACLCQEPLGGPCVVPDSVALGVCPDGNWICIEGVDVCQPEPDCCEPGVPCTPTDANGDPLLGVCAEGQIVCDGSPLGRCVPLNAPSPEVCDLLDNDCDGDVDEDLGGSDCLVPGGVGRCGEGILECINGSDVCVPFGAMPELCNGLDDDCDGKVDNLAESWSKTFADPTIPTKATVSSDGEAAACGFIDVCMCPNGPAAGHVGATFDEFLEAWSPPVCQCGEGLAPAGEAMMSVGDPASSGSSSDVGSQSACSTTGGASGGVATLWLVALIALRRRRR